MASFMVQLQSVHEELNALYRYVDRQYPERNDVSVRIDCAIAALDPVVETVKREH